MNRLTRIVHEFMHHLGNWSVTEHALYAVAGIAVVYIFLIVGRDKSVC